MAISSLQRGIAVLDALGGLPEGLRFKEISDVLGDPSPRTISKVLDQLEDMHVITHGSDRRYRLSGRIFHWTTGLEQEVQLPELIRPELELLCRELECTAACYTPKGQRLYCVSVVRDPNSPSLLSPGRSVPMVTQALGGIHFFTPDELTDDVLQTHMEIMPTRLVDLPGLRRQVESWQLDGVQDDFAQVFIGVRRLSVPICRRGSVISAIGLGIAPQRFDEEGLREVAITALRGVVKRVQHRLA